MKIWVYDQSLVYNVESDTMDAINSLVHMQVSLIKINKSFQRYAVVMP